jgi:hypothetical protein
MRVIMMRRESAKDTRVERPEDASPPDIRLGALHLAYQGQTVTHADDRLN